MIVVIADDFTGAAEIAGIGLRYGLAVELTTAVDPSANPQLLIVATDTRSMKEHEAIEELKFISNEVTLLKPDLFFKKIDSVLRGHVIEEIKVHMNVMAKQRAVIIAANPALGRSIVKGTYYYNDEPIHQSNFSQDPEFPVKSSDVLEMLRPGDSSPHVKALRHSLPEKGIIVGEVAEAGDFEHWASRLDESDIIAGSAPFFSAILKYKKIAGKAVVSPPSNFELPLLLVSGTRFNKSAESIKQLKIKGGPVSYLAHPETSDLGVSSDMSDELKRCRDEILSLINIHDKAIIAIDQTTGQGPSILREQTATIVAELYKILHIPELLIEGGSTAAAILRKMQLNRFTPVEELAPGVVRMKALTKKNLHVTVKPGSYDWPDNAWKF